MACRFWHVRLYVCMHACTCRAEQKQRMAQLEERRPRPRACACSCACATWEVVAPRMQAETEGEAKGLCLWYYCTPYATVQYFVSVHSLTRFALPCHAMPFPLPRTSPLALTLALALPRLLRFVLDRPIIASSSAASRRTLQPLWPLCVPCCPAPLPPGPSLID